MKQKLIFIIVIGTIACCYFNNTEDVDLNQGLVLHCSFDNDGLDLSGTESSAKFFGVHIDTINAAVGSACAKFDGIDDYVEFPGDISYFKDNYSISIWCYWEDDKQWTRILDFNQNEPKSGPAVTWLLGRKDKGTNAMWFDQWINYKGVAVESIIDFNRNDPPDAFLNYNVVMNKWTHYVVVYDRSKDNSLGMQINTKNEPVPLTGKVTLFIDGAEVYATEYCLKPEGDKTTRNWLGRSAFANDPFFKGKMDDFRIYNRILSLDEIEQLNLNNNIL